MRPVTVGRSGDVDASSPLIVLDDVRLLLGTPTSLELPVGNEVELVESRNELL
jgi:hypothetical protein